jgi:tetratricopeptide (TPR) repeat protein
MFQEAKEKNAMPLTLLFLAANPTDTALLRVDQEYRAIDAALRGAEYRDRFTLKNHGAVRVEDFPALLMRYQPHILHFSGHGIRANQVALEDSAGHVRPVGLEVIAGWFAALPDNLRCVVLNACDSEDQARAIAEHIDCVIGMSQAISDSGALAFSTAFYQALAFGRNLQTAFDLACLALRAQNADEQAIPRLISLRTDPAQIVLATPQASTSSLRSPCETSSRSVDLHDPAPVILAIPQNSSSSLRSPRETSPSPVLTPPVDLFALPFRNDPFLGRMAELDTLAYHLTGNSRPRLLTLYATGGQGKTTLARQAAERFAYSWPGGVLAVSFENLPTRPDLVTRLAEFLHLDPNQRPDLLERQIIRTLDKQRTLLLLDNAETLVDDLDRAAPIATDLIDFLQNQLPPTVTLFVTSRRRLGLPGEVAIELGGLPPVEGARLFQQYTPDQTVTLDLTRAEALSEQVAGHPLSLRLLGIAYNNFGSDLPTFLQQFETHLTHAADKHKRLDHRQRTLFTSIATSVQPLDPKLKALFCNLALFHAPFRASDAAAIFAHASDDQSNGVEPSSSLTPFDKGGPQGILIFTTQLHRLWQRGLLERQFHPTGSTQFELYHLLPPLRLYAEQTAPLPPEILQRFAQVYGDLIRWIHAEIDKDPTASLLARLSAPDLERAREHTQDRARADYNRYLGYVEFRLGHPWKGKPHLEQALAWARIHDQELTANTLGELGTIYDSTGQPQEALKYFHESLSIFIEIGNRGGEATILNDIGAVYDGIGQIQEALKYFREALPIRQEANDQAGEATTLNNIGLVYGNIGQLQEALKYYREALPISQKVGDRAGEAVTLNNIGMVYHIIGQPQEALRYYHAALPIRQEVGDRAGEATTIHNMAWLLADEGKNQQSIDLHWQILSIRQEIGAVAGEATTLYALASLLGLDLNDPAQAIPLLHRSIELLRTNNLPQDSSGQTLAEHKSLLAELEKRTNGLGSTIRAYIDKLKNILRSLFRRKPA